MKALIAIQAKELRTMRIQ